MLGKAESTEEKPFGPNQEKAIISLAFDAPEFFDQIAQYMSYKYFQKREHQYVYAIMEQEYKRHNCIPTRELVLDTAQKELTIDDEWEPIIETINRKSNLREIPTIKSILLDWVRNKAWGVLYTDEAYQAYINKDYEALERIVGEANKVTDVSDAGINFFDNIPMLFDEEIEEKLTTGFTTLDAYINEGGPTRGDVFVWMAPTGGNKSILLIHSGRMCAQKNLKVLHVTLELSAKKTMQRYMGSFTDEKIKTRVANRATIEQRLYKIRNSTAGDLMIVEFPPDEVTVDTLLQLVDILKRTKNWKPDVLIVDYLELMMARNTWDNKEDYQRQKRTATQLRGLAKKANVLVFTATQTNRDGLGGKNGKGGSEGESLDLNKVAESYGKTMPVDYCVSINQTQDEYQQVPANMRLYIAKNRNGPKFKTVRAKVNYSSMNVKEGML